jgi:23S rRNA (cytosine1962-C5)-methyltransferase
MTATPIEIKVLCSQWDGYALLDSGRRRKLERFGSHVLVRSEPKAWWEPALPDAEWALAHAVYEDDRDWRIKPGIHREWSMHWRELALQARLTDASKHVGVFPEQSPHLEFIQWQGHRLMGKKLNLLNLFSYTGVSTLAAASAGFSVTHVDASKPAVAWARHNQELSGLTRAPIRWILDDALKFVRREVRRGVRYDALVLDPPSFGRGPAGEVWKVETNLPELLALCRQALVEKPLFVLLTLYNLEASSLMLGNLLRQMMHGMPGRLSIGELALAAENPVGRLLPLSLWGRWEA